MERVFGFTCVIPFFNGNKYLQAAIDSVMVPEAVPYEIIIVVDVGSVHPIFDNEKKIIQVIYNSGPSRGAGVARALGFRHASFRYVCFLDADDLWVPEKISIQLEEMQRRDLAFSFGGWRHFGLVSSNSDLGIYDRKPDISSFLKKEFVIGCVTVCIDKAQIPFVPGNTLRLRNDYKMWFDIIRQCENRNLPWGSIKSCLGLHRMHSDSLSASRVESALAQFKFYRACGFNFAHSAYYMVFYIVRTFGTR